MITRLVVLLALGFATLALTSGCKDRVVTEEHEVITDTKDQPAVETKTERKEKIETRNGVEVERKTEIKEESDVVEDKTNDGERKGVDVQVGPGGVDVRVRGDEKDDD